MEDTENADSEAIPKSGDASPSQGKSCALCGCATPAVRCDRCNSQIFCLSCDDMYHRHPKRKLHLRKAVDSIWSTGKSPRLRRRTDLPGDPCKIPIPPPRTKKRERHTIGGRIFLKSGLELGSFGHSKVFDPKNLMPSSKDFFAGQKSPASLGESHLDDDASSQVMRPESAQLYENENVANAAGNVDGSVDDRSPWNATRPNIASPIQVSIPSNSPDIVANGQSFGYPSKPHSQSAADLSVGGHHPGHLPYHHPFHGPYPYVHPAPLPPMHPYSHSMAHLNCAQCLSSSSWSNLMSPHPSPYFHPMPWGSAQNTMTRPPHAGQHLKQHSHGDLASYPDSNFHYPYPGAGYYHNGPPVVDPNFIKDLHEQAEMQKLKKDGTNTKQNPGSGGEEMEVEQPAAETPSSEARASAPQGVQQPEEEAAPVLPAKPTEPWACVHCTFINPPGIHICQICCKTSYGNSNKGGEEQEEESGGIRPRSRDSESPLVNRDALINSPGFADFQEAQKHDQYEQMESPFPDSEPSDAKTTSEVAAAEAVKLTTETQTSTSTKTTDVQTQNVYCKSIASSTDSIFPKQEISVQTEVEAASQNLCSVATDPMISSQSLESLLSGVSAPPYHNRRAGWGRGATSFSTQSLYERGRSRSPMPRSLSLYNEAQQQQQMFQSEEAMHSASQAWLYTDPMYFKPHNAKEDYFDGTWGSMDRLNRRVKHKKDKGKVESVRPKFHRSLDDLKSDKRPEMLHTQELLMLQTVKEAERCGFSLEDLHVAYLHCGKENPVYWLEDNWPAMIKNVIALAAKYGEDNEENDVGVITATEAKDALRIHRGDIWDAVTECIENRQRKILELTVRGNFTQKQISDALKHNEGNVELAYADLVRASTRRHKFILSPGLSEDSEDLNAYNPTEEGSADHHVGHIRLARTTDVSGESKTEKKKSDFLTKLSAIRTAQSERRKAREEKELIRETIAQDYEVEVAPKEKDVSADATVSMSREDSKEVEENIQDIPVVSPVEQEELEVEMKPTDETPEVGKVVSNVKEGAEDSIPIDFDTNWSESQGEWIEEYSDEQWEEDSQWVGLGKKFQKMEKEFEEEAMQMAALWEKEELEDDVFEEEAKELKTEPEVVPDSDRKFDEWVKANLKVDSFEYEEEEAKNKALKEDVANDSLVDSIELEVGRPSPLQHYPTSHDLSLKSHFESEWVDLPADAEIEKLAHDIVCEGSDIENKFEEEEIVPYEEEKKLSKLNDLEGSDEDWEKIEMDEQQLQDVNELDQFAFPDKEGDIEKNIEEMDQALMENIIQEKESELAFDTAEVKIEDDSKVLYKNLDSVVNEDTLAFTSTKEALPEVPVSDTVEVPPTEELPLSDGDQPRPPVRRKSKLNSAAIEQALKNHAEISADIPPVLPQKTKNKDSQPNVSDLYAMPDRAAKVSQEQVNVVSDRSVPQKPPRLNLSPELGIQRDKEEIEPEVPPKTIVSKDASPVTSLSYESDSNCFADSESDTEIKLRRQKNIHRKAPKYENDTEDAEIENISKIKLDKMALDEEKTDLMLESNLDFELDDDIDPALIEPLPPMKSIDFDPELPILLGGRGRGLADLEDVDAPKAFREDTTRPLQLFKATKRETPTNTLSMSTSGFESIQSQSSIEQQVEETSFITRTKDELPARPLELAPSRSMPVSENLQESAAAIQDSSHFPVSSVYENQVLDKHYYNETIMPPQPEATERLPEKWEAEPLGPEQLISEVGFEQNIEQVEPSYAVEPSPTVEEQEMGLSEMEGLSAAVDYYFGRYNEITVTRPKKKTSARAKPASPSPKPMSASEIAPSRKSEAPSEMEKSATVVLEASIPRQELPQKEVQAVSAPVASREIPTPAGKVKEPAPSEYLPFAEDYLFGCYNEVVVVPRKKKTIALAPIPKLGASLTKVQNVSKEQKPPVQPVVPPDEPVQTVPEPFPEEPVEEPVEELSKEEHAIPSETSSLIYDEVFHDLPADILANQSFDDGGSIYYESFQDAVEEIQDTSSVPGNVMNIKARNVHFEEPAVPVAPPRRTKAQPGQKPKAAASAVSSESYADEYLFRQYEERSQAKKKLPVCSEDFRMKQGFEPTEFPCDTPLLPDEQQEGVISSEISVETPPKIIASLKNKLEYDFGDSEQSLDSVKHEVIEPSIVDAVSSSKESQIGVSVVKDSSVSGGFSIEATMEVASDVREDNMQRTDIQISESTGSFEELFLPNQSEDRALTESPAGSSDMHVTEESQIISDDLAIESSVNDIQPPRPSKPKPYDQGSYPSAPSGLEMDQFVFIEQTQDIIDDSYTLYDIQESLQSSLACDLNYVDVKNNIEDECTDDSEKEWKRNEDIKNSLNASFLSTVSSARDFDDQVETILDISEKSSLEESKDLYPEADELKKEELNLDEEESKIFMDKNYFEHLESPSDVTEACTFEQSDYIVIDSQMGEALDNQLSAEISQDVRAIESDYESKDSFSVDENLKESEFAKPESLQKLTTTDDRDECSSEIPQESVESVIQPLSVLCQAATEISDTADSAVIVEDLPITQEDTLEFSEEVIHKAGKEEDSVTEDQQIDILEDLEAPGELSDNGDDLSDDSLAPSTHSSVSTQIAVSMKLGLKEPEPDESSLFEFSENLENDNEVSAVVSLPTPTTAEKVSSGEETFSLEHISESEDTEIPEFTQTVSTTGYVTKEEYESEMKGFEYGEDIEMNIEQAMAEGDKFTPTPPLESESCMNLSRSTPEIDLEVSDSVESHAVEEALEISKKEPDLSHEKSFKSLTSGDSLTESTDRIATEFESEDILQDSDAENMGEVVSEPYGYSGIYDAYEIKDDIKFISEDTVDEVIDVSSSVSDYSQMKEEAETDQGFVHYESILPEDMQLRNTEIKLSEPDSVETTTDSLFDEENVEESSLSIMSHFYDEWYQNVQPSTQFTLLSTDSIYAKYGAAESSESGNESGDDNVVCFKPSEDVTQEDKVLTTENLVDQIAFKDQVKDLNIIRMDSSDAEKSNFMEDVQLQNITDKSDFDNISSKTELLHETLKESKQEWVEDQEISEEPKMINDFMSYDKELTETVTFISENQESMLSVEEQDASETKFVESKFSTSKSCQTEDSFEEDIFFDSFDDTFTIPSYIHLPIEVQSKPQMSDISVQCEIISSEAIIAKVTSTVTEIQAMHAASETTETPQDSPERPKLSEEIPKEPSDESSCESFEESDSDIFIESHSSHDELDVPNGKRGLLYAEIDSDTGFSSGSECGWTQGREKHLKGKKISGTDVQLQEISSTTVCVEKEVAGSVQTFIVSQEKSIVESQIAETLNISEKSMVSEGIEGEQEAKDSDAKVCPFPPEIIERAVTPVAVPQFPSFEEDLVFVEVEEHIEEAPEGAREEVVSTTPAIEYFYGPLPGTVKIESPPDVNERFFETASELSESLSFPLDSTESFSDSSVTFSEKIPKVVNLPDRDTEMLEEESFADTCSSFRAEDSVSEYYALPESITSRSESENLILTKAESSEVPSNKVLADFTTVTCDEDIKREDVQVDNTGQETKSLDISESKEDVVSKNIEAAVISSELELGTEVRHKVLSKKETLSEEVTVFVESQKTVSQENIEIMDVKVPVDSGMTVCADDSKSQVPASDVGLSEYEAVEPLKSSADVPPVPSDIIRYLYYDDSITFDDDSYHTQSEILEVPPLPADEPHAVAHTSDPCETAVDKDSEILQDIVLLEKSTDKVCSTPMEPEKQLEGNMISESTQKFVSKEAVSQESPELQKMPEESIPEEICIPPVSELKLATVEIISAEDVSELPSGQIPESVQNIVSVDEKVPEPEVLPLDTEFEDFHPVELKKTSPEVPQVPSDIVRYLYYDDDITFEETTDVTFDDTSFHSQSDALGLPSEDRMTQHSDRDGPEISDLDVASADNLELMEELESSGAKLSELSEDSKMKLSPEMKKDSFEDSSYKHESSSAGQLSLPPLDSSECVEKWFDIEADPSTNGKKEKHMDSEQHSSTKSSALKDSEQPCIPEYILSPIPDGNLPATKTDIDEVTDISTHFTMTDDSDKFSDIESDTSLNFEDECILPLEIEPVEIENAVLFESSIDEEDDDMNLPTPEVKCLPGGFQFPTPELSGGFVEKSVDPSEPQEEFDECVTSTEFSEQYREQFTECLTSSEVLGQQPSEEADSSKVATEFSDNEPKELFESGVSCDVSEMKEHFTEPLTSSEQHSKEGMFYDIVQDHTDQEFKEFHECDNLNEISEISKEQFSECLTGSEEQSKESVSHEVHLNQELMETMDEQISLVDVSEHFTECELLSEETGYEVSQESVDQQPKEPSYDYAFTDLRDENGNIPESTSTVPEVPVSSTKVAITSELDDQFEITKTELSSYTSPVKETKVESSFSITEADIIQVCTKDSIESSQMKEPEQIFHDKDEDIDESCYTAPNEDSVGNEEDSISTEMTDNWVDAEGKNIEVDESIYDLPLEEMNLMQPEVSIQDIVNLSEESYFGKSFESISYKEKVVDSVKSDLVLSEVEKGDTPKIETFILPSVDETKSDISADAEELSDKFVSISEDENAISIAKDSCQISEETSLKMDEHLMTFKEKSDDSTDFTQVLSSEKCLETSPDVNGSLLSSDIKGIQEVKMESESEMKTAVQEEVNIECGSAVSGTEPKFLLGETVFDTQEVGAEEGSSKELCADEKVIPSSLSVAAERKDSVEITDADTKEDIKVTESTLLRDLELKQTENLRELISKVIQLDSCDIPQEENITTDTYREKEPELVTLTTQSETAELLEVSDDFSAECIAAVTSESAFFENISPAIKKVVYEEPHIKEVLKVESKEISGEAEIELNLERSDDVDKKNLVDDADIQLRKPETSDELETVDLKCEFSFGSCKEETVVVLKESVCIVDKETDVDVDKTPQAVDVDSQLCKPETPGELEIYNFKGEFSVDTCEKETEFVLKKPGGILDKETDVDTDKKSLIINVDSQLSKPETPGELETYDFKGDFSVDSCEKETEVVLKKPSGIPDKETFVDSDKKSTVIDGDSQFRKFETPGELETCNFKGEFSVDSCEKESAIGIKEPIDSTTDKDFKTSEISDFKMESPGTEITVEIVDFKMISNGTDFKDQIPTYEEKISEFIEQTSRNYVQDFDGKTKDISYKIIDSPETVDFKGQGVNVDAEKLKIQLSRISREDTETRFTTDDTHFASNDKIISSEIVDFKGTLGGISTPTEFREEETSFARQDTYKTPPTIQQQNLKAEASDHLPEIVDFRGQIVCRDLDIKVEKEDVLSESTNYSKSREVEEKFSTSDDSNIRLKIDDSHNIVDFKGQVICSDELSESKTEVRDTTVFTEVKEFSNAEEIVETVDFKLFINVGDQSSQEKEVTLTQKDIHPLKDTDVLNYDTLEEITDFRGSVCSGTTVLESQPDISKEKIDTSQQLFKDKTIDMETINDVHKEIAFESRGNVYHEENVTMHSVSNEASVAESSELYSCVETLSAADTSMQFYSLSDDLDDTLNTTSEDFTDVPSHFTSTDDSDKWSDVEGDLSMEDVEFDRDKTPTRTEVKSNVLGEITETRNAEHQTPVQDETTKPDSTLEEVSVESYVVNKSIQKETFAKDEKSIVDSAMDVVFSDKIIPRYEPEKSDIISYPEISDSLPATVSMNLTERDTEDVEYISKDLLPKHDIIESIVSESSEKEISEALFTSVGEAASEFFIVSGKSEEDTKEITESFDAQDVKESSDISVSKSHDLVLKDISTEEISHKIPEPSASVDFKGFGLTESSESHEVLNEEHVSLDSKASFTDKVEVIPDAEKIKLLPTDKSIDLSVSTSADYTDISTHQLSSESSEKWSDVENEMHLEDLEVDFKGLLETQKSSKEISNVHGDQTVNLDMEQKIDIGSETEKDSTVEAPLMEHFAAIKSLNESLTVANTFSSFDAETAVSKTHEDSTDISSQFEKTESECWLEVATDNSVSEFAEDVALSAETEEKLVAFSDKITADEGETSIPCQFDSEMMRTSTISTSSSYTDLDNLDQTSDTCADISLQGATTESSDKWSDIEAEALIDDVLYGNTDLTENVESTDFVQSIKKLEESREKDETPLLESQPVLLSSVESTEVCASATAKVTSKSEPLVKVSPERKSEALKVTSLSFEGPDSFSINLTDSGPSSIPTESSLSSPSNVTTTVLSDDDLTNVTPLDATTEESDKWSDISGDTSIEEIEEDSSVSLKASLKLQESESNAISSEFKVGLPTKEADGVAVEEKEVLDARLSETEASVKETVICESISKKKEILLDLQNQQDSLKVQKDEKVTFNLSETATSQKSTAEVKIADSQSSEMECISDYNLEKESISEKELSSIEEVIQTDASVTLKSEEVAIDNSQLRQHIETEDVSESKITDESETLDTYTDVLTHTLSPETSEAYCELESDHSVEDIEAQPEESIETPPPIQQIVDTSRQSVPECYENSLTAQEIAEEADEYGLDAIPENELENYEDEEYSLSEHFEINEDELIYPLPYNDWIEQSFELKEYGIEAAFSESGSDIHGLGIASDIHGLGIADEEYDDEDIQRAIDFNISNFEDDGGNNIETVVTTESFKTLSNDVSPHLKHSDKEFDSWSTADAPSIEEEEEDLAEHDNILSKIDELLAEDFGDLGEYQTESPLKYEEDYFFKDISTPEYLHSEDYAEIKESSLPEETLLHVDKEFEKTINSRIVSNEEFLKKDSKIPDSVTSDVTFENDDKILKTESLPSEVILKKDFKISEPEHVSEQVTSKKDSKISESEAVSSKFSVKKDSNISESESISSQFSLKKDSEISESKAVSSQFSVKKHSEVSESEDVSSQFSLKTHSETVVAKIHEKNDSTTLESESLTSEITLKKDSELSEPKAETVSSQFSLKKDSKISDSETVVAKIGQIKDSKALESESLTSELTLKKDSELSEPKAETVSSQFSLKIDSKISDSETVVAKICQIKDSKALESESVTSEITLKKDSELSEPKAETISSQFSLEKDSKVSDSENVVGKICQIKDSKASESKLATSEIALKKDSELSESETVTSKLSLKKDSIVSEHESVSNQVVLKKDSEISDSETVSSKFSLMKDSKNSEPETVSSKMTDKDSKTFEIEAESKISLRKDSRLSELESVSGEITLSKDSKTSETVSGKISLQNDSKVTESEKVSVKQTVTTSTEEVENAAVVCEKVIESKIKASLSSSDESSHLLSGKRETTQVVFSSSEEADTSLFLSSAESKTKQETTQAVSMRVVQSADVETEVSVKLKSGVESAVVDRGKDFTLTTDEASASTTLFSKDSQIKDQSAGSITLPASETDSSFDIPSKQLSKSSTASAAEYVIKETSKTLSEKTETIESSRLSDSLKLMLTSESNIPEPKVQDNLSEKSVSETLTIISKEQTSTDSVASEVKPDIPRKVKRRSLDTREVLQKEDVEKKPSLPPKLSKRHSTSSSPSESPSSSSSMESLASFESATSGRSRKSSLKSSEDTSYHSESPEVPARRSRSSKLSSSSRSRSRDSEDSSSSSCLRIRRRSSNFRDSEPIDLSKKRASIDERILKLQNEGKCQTREKAFIAAKLIEMQFEEEDALLASRQCNTVYNAIKFLTQLCELCNCRFPIGLMTSMIQCTHRACKECLKAHFTSLIYDRSVFTLLCPVCRKPDITDQNIQEYFNHLDIMLQNILDTKVYDLFQRKLRDEVLTKDPNFHWCSQCSSGFIASPRLKKLYCPDCSAITCALCHQTWELEHEGVHCERFQQWKDMHTPEPPPAGLVKFLVDRGIGCPCCGLVYGQACGGCMMYKCSHCSFEFCGFCTRPLKRGRECSNDVCEMRGLHIHHVHNCLFYLRDLDISEIQMLLEEESVPYLTIPPKDQIVKSRCQVREQKHAHGVITEDRCGRDIEPYCGGLCRTHYYEYLAELLRENSISPLSIMTIQDLQSMLRKSRVMVPERMKGESSEDYYERLLKLITSTLT